MKILVTGGAGFIGSAVIRHWVDVKDADVVNVDTLTYAANVSNVASVSWSPRYCFERVDIRDRASLVRVVEKHRPDCILHLAAETHVDRSIDGPLAFVETNVMGTAVLLDVAHAYWAGLDRDSKARFRFVHVSTDEVYGTLGEDGSFSEESAYRPNSPYAASKAASDHLARAWHETYRLPVIVTNCSNNFGPYQFPEKLIPLMIIKALRSEQLPVYGAGKNIRDWLYVEDHARALWEVMSRGEAGRTYNIGGNCERTNLEVVETICSILDRHAPRADGRRHRSAINFVTDRPGHDFRYAVDCRRIGQELGWFPSPNFESLLESTVLWYLENREWWEEILDQKYGTNRLGAVRNG